MFDGVDDGTIGRTGTGDAPHTIRPVLGSTHPSNAVRRPFIDK